MFLVLQQSVPFQRDIRSDTKFCLVFVLMHALFHKVKTVWITIHAYPLKREGSVPLRDGFGVQVGWEASLFGVARKVGRG